MVAYTYRSKIEELKVSNSLSENIYFDLDFLLVLGLPMKQYSVVFFSLTLLMQHLSCTYTLGNSLMMS